MKIILIIILLSGCAGSKTETTQQDTLPEGVGVYGIMTELPEDSTVKDSLNY